MTGTLLDRASEPAETPTRVHAPSRRRRSLEIVLELEAAALTLVVAWSGSSGWRAGRVALVLAAAALCVFAMRRGGPKTRALTAIGAGCVPGNVRLWELPDTGHTRGLATPPREWEGNVESFLDRALAPTAVSPTTGRPS